MARPKGRNNSRFNNLELDDMLYGEPGLKLYSQAERVALKFGGPYQMAKFMRKATGRPVNESLVARWVRQGRIPTWSWDDVISTAEFFGITLEPEIFDPRPRKFRLSDVGHCHKLDRKLFDKHFERVYGG